MGPARPEVHQPGHRAQGARQAPERSQVQSKFEQLSEGLNELTDVVWPSSERLRSEHGQWFEQLGGELTGFVSRG